MYFPNTEIERAEAVIKRYRDELASRTFTKHGLKTSMCFGLTSVKNDDTTATMIERVTYALYEARRNGPASIAIKE